jgi:hypothetical protein
MVASRLATAAAGVVLSLVASAVLWWYFDVALFFLAVPFVPFLFRGRGGSDDRPPVRTCPECGFGTRDPSFEHCPRDGTALETD